MSEINKILPDVELLNALEVLCGFPISLEYIKAPNAAFIRTICVSFLKHFQMNVEAMDVMPWNDQEHVVEHKELYDDMSIFILFRIMREFMITVGVPDFSIKDILEPKPKRTRKILAYLVTFWNFGVKMMKRYEEIECELQKELDEERKLMDEYEALKEEYTSLMNLKLDPDQKKELQALKIKFAKQLTDAIARKESINKEYQILKTNIATEQRQYSELEIEIISEKERITEFHNRILKSPTRFASDIEELKRKVMDEDNKIIEMSKKREQKKDDITSLQMSIEKFKNYSEHCNSLLELIENLRKDALIIDEKEQTFDELSKKLSDLTANMNKMKEMVTHSEQKWAQAHMQRKMQVGGHKQIIEVKQKSAAKEGALCKALETKVDEIEQEIKTQQETKQSIEKEINDIKLATTKEACTKKQQYDDYVKQFMMEMKDAEELFKGLR